MNRRSFLARSIKVFFTLLGVALLSTVLAFLYPSRIRRREVRFFPLMDEHELPRRGVKTVVLSYESRGRSLSTRVFVVNNRGRVFTLSPVCSHLGCLVNWQRTEGAFLCPCHGGRYDIEGNVLSGPPPAPLTRLPMKTLEGRVYVGLKV